MRSLSNDARRARPALGTLVEMRLADASIAARAFECAFQAVERVHRLMSRQERDSDVARLNRAAARTPVAVDAWTWDVLRRAQELHEVPDGRLAFSAAPGSRGSHRRAEHGPYSSRRGTVCIEPARAHAAPPSLLDGRRPPGLGRLLGAGSLRRREALLE